MKGKLLGCTFFILLVVVPIVMLALGSFVMYQYSTFKETTATYVSTSDKVKKISKSVPTYDQTNYETRYEYTHNYVYNVDGKEYYLKKASSFNDPEKVITVKYNPNNPNDTMTGTPWILFGGILLLSVFILSVYICILDRCYFGRLILSFQISCMGISCSICLWTFLYYLWFWNCWLLYNKSLYKKVKYFLQIYYLCVCWHNG